MTKGSDGRRGKRNHGKKNDQIVSAVCQHYNTDYNKCKENGRIVFFVMKNKNIKQLPT